MAKNSIKTETVKDEIIKETVKKTPVLSDSIVETPIGYEIIVNGSVTAFVGDKRIAFSEALRAYKILKSV